MIRSLACLLVATSCGFGPELGSSAGQGPHMAAPISSAQQPSVLDAADKQRISAEVERLKKKEKDAEICLDDTSGLLLSIDKVHIGTRAVKRLRKQLISDQDVVNLVNAFYNEKNGLLLTEGPTAQPRVVEQRPHPNLDKRSSVWVQQRFAGLDVFGAQAVLTVNREAATIEGVNAKFSVLPKNLNSTPAITAQQAIAKAGEQYASQLEQNPGLKDEEQLFQKMMGNPAPSAKLLIFDPRLLRVGSGDACLAYEVSLGTYKFFVDGKDGSLLFQTREVQHSRNRITYDSEMRLSCPGSEVLNESGSIDGEIVGDARRAHEYAGIAYDYYFSTFGRDSYDSHGHAIESCVRFGGFANAAWVQPIEKLLYGDGYASALDVVAHEITHAVMRRDSPAFREIPFGESGAVNESLADFFGEMVKGKQGVENWLIGESLPGHSKENPVRDMANPHLDGFDRNADYNPATNRGQPATMDEYVRPDDRICRTASDQNDHGCIHLNSGIFNHGLQLATQAVGRNKMQSIVYGTLQQLVDASFSGAAATVVLSCNQLIKPDSKITRDDCTAIKGAFKAVGIR